MTENPLGGPNTAGFRSRHKFLLSQGKDLSTHQTCDRRPTQEPENQHQIKHTDLGIELHGIHCSTQNDDQGCGRNTVENIYNTHDQVIHPFSEVSGDTAQQDTQER